MRLSDERTYVRIKLIFYQSISQSFSTKREMMKVQEVTSFRRRKSSTAWLWRRNVGTTSCQRSKIWMIRCHSQSTVTTCTTWADTDDTWDERSRLAPAVYMKEIDLYLSSGWTKLTCSCRLHETSRHLPAVYLALRTYRPVTITPHSARQRSHEKRTTRNTASSCMTSQ